MLVKMTEISIICASTEIIFLLFNLLQPVTVDGHLKLWPNNTEVVVGQTTRLHCSSTEPYFVNWEHIPWGARHKNFVYFFGEVVEPYNDRFRVIRGQGTGQYDLEILSVKMEDSGTYRCVDKEGMGERREAELVVLNSPPKCNVEESLGASSCNIMKPMNISVLCKVSYLGNIGPSVVCPMTTIENRCREIDASSGTVQCISSYKADPMALDSNTHCHTDISNIPSNTFEANIAFVKVETVKKTIDRPERVVCQLKNDRDCQYKWIRADRNNEIASVKKSLSITEPGLYRCEADCPLFGSICKVQPIEIVFLPTEETDNWDTAAVPMATGTTLAVAVAVATGFHWLWFA